MNNYKKQPFIPAIQKTSTLVVLSIIAVLSLIVSINSITIDISPSYDLKIKAARLLKKLEKVGPKSPKAGKSWTYPWPRA